MRQEAVAHQQRDLERPVLALGALAIAIADPTISSRHASFHVDGSTGSVVIEDHGSTNGTYVNGKIIKKHALQHGDVITVGHHTLRFVENEADEEQDEFEKTMVISPRDASRLNIPAAAAPQPVAAAAQSGQLAGEIDDDSLAAREIAALTTEIERLRIGTVSP